MNGTSILQAETEQPYYDLGSYHRPIETPSPQAQIWFDRGMVWAYAFNHEEAIRCFDELAARGLLLHPAEELFRATDPRLDPVVAEAAQRHRPVVVASGYPWVSEPLQVAALAARFPATPFIMTNGGQFNISGLGMANAWMALEQCPNLCVQTAGEYRQDFIENVASQLGGRRILLASSAPQFDQRYELARARQAVLTADQQHLMLGGAASQLFA